MDTTSRDCQRIRDRATHPTIERCKAAALKKYAPDIECTEIQREEGAGTRPAALMTFTGKKFDTLGKLALRLNGMYWKGRSLASSTMLG